MPIIAKKIELSESEFKFPSGGFDPSLLKNFSLAQKAAYIRLHSEALASMEDFAAEVEDAIAAIVSESRRKDYAASLHH